jgi:hypothetical protein
MKTFTMEQDAALPELGYWLCKYESKTNSDKSYELYCIDNGEVQLIKLESVDGNLNFETQCSWESLDWTLTPTKSEISECDPTETTYFQVKTHQRLMVVFEQLPKGFEVTAPNDI